MATTCSGDDPDAALRAPSAERWHAGAAFGVFGSDLSFGGGPAFSMERRAVSASFEYRASVTTTVGGGAGAGLGGLMVVDGARYTIGLGWLLTASYSRRLVDGRGRAPFVLLGVSLGASGASTQPQAPRSTAPPPTTGLYAFDVRAGLTVGKTFWSVLSPYASLRAYGGPVIWTYKGKTVVGSDDYHVQGAFGVAAALPEGWDAFAEGAPGGERGVTVGIGRSF